MPNTGSPSDARIINATPAVDPLTVDTCSVNEHTPAQLTLCAWKCSAPLLPPLLVSEITIE